MNRPQNDVLENWVGNIVGLVGDATIAERAAGLVWYPAFSRAIAAHGAVHGYSREDSLALFAALSPRARINRNWDNFKRACAEGNPAKCLGLTHSHRDKIARFLAGLFSIEAVISGDKVSAFYGNLAGDLSRVTIDRHAIAAALGHCPDNLSLSHAQYRRYALAYQAAAKMLDLEPAQVQAIVWIVWRRKKGIHDDGGITLVA